MKQKNTIVLAALFLILIIPGCHKEEVIMEREYPRLDISEEILMSDEGAVFEASILTQNADILDKGFVWAEGVFPDVEKDSHISLGGGGGTGTFSAVATYDLVKGRGYYVHAYARTTDRLVYSKAVPFISTTNGLELTLDSFNPERGSFNDTIVITGSNLSYFKDKIEVHFANVAAAIQSSTDTTITITVPEIQLSKVKISVTAMGVQKIFEDFFFII